MESLKLHKIAYILHLDGHMEKWHFFCFAGIFFFVDSNNGWDGFSEERDCLSSHILEKDEFNEIPLMVVANKQDLPGAASCEDIAEALQLYEIKDRYFGARVRMLSIKPCAKWLLRLQG